MKRQISLSLKFTAAMTAAAIAALFVPITAESEQTDSVPDTSAYAYCLYCANNGETLAQQRGNERLPMASTTKIMTAILGIEAAQNSNQEQNVTITPEMYAEGSSMYLKAGETVELTELVGGMLMVSGNDAANAIALTVGGSFDGFAEMMNKKSAELGLSNTHFVTPSGLDADGHYTTAAELAKIMAYCMDNEKFAEIDGGSSVTVHFVAPQGKEQTYYNENKLLSRYDHCVAGKTGYTDKAGRTLVTCAEKDGVRLIAVTLNDGDDWNDHESLYDYGFRQLTMEKPETDIGGAPHTIAVVGGESDEAAIIAGDAPLVCTGADGADVTTVCELPRFVYAPISEGKKLGEVKYYTGGVYAGKADITAAESVGAIQETTSFTENLLSFFRACSSSLKRARRDKR